MKFVVGLVGREIQLVETIKEKEGEKGRETVHILRGKRSLLENLTHER